MVWRKAPQVLVDCFEAALTGDSTVERRKMFGYPAAFHNGHLFTGLHQESWILKLASADREQMQRKYGAKPFQPMPGRVMREFLCIPKPIIATPVVLSEWLERSKAYVGSLPPKRAKSAPERSGRRTTIPKRR